MFRVCHTVLSVHCSLMVMFSCVFVTYPFGVVSVWYFFFVSITDLSLLLYLVTPIFPIHWSSVNIPVTTSTSPSLTKSLFRPNCVFFHETFQVQDQCTNSMAAATSDIHSSVYTVITAVKIQLACNKCVYNLKYLCECY